MALNWKVLAKLGAIPPQAWDAVIPHGPVGHLWGGVTYVHFGDEAGLNPQPLPPRNVLTGARILEAIVLGRVAAGATADAFLMDIDDWCGTGWPKRWPLPPKAREWDESLVFAGAAAAAAQLAAQYDHFPEMQDALVKATEQLADRAAR